jgi:hypothetical protein
MGRATELKIFKTRRRINKNFLSVAMEFSLPLAMEFSLTLTIARAREIENIKLLEAKNNSKE